jgi:hypothetical protein
MYCEMDYMQCVSVVFSNGATLEWQRTNLFLKYPKLTCKNTSKSAWNGASVESVKLNKDVIFGWFNLENDWGFGSTLTHSDEWQTSKNMHNDNAKDQTSYPFTILRFLDWFLKDYLEPYYGHQGLPNLIT